jgi:hypothetical protein
MLERRVKACAEGEIFSFSLFFVATLYKLKCNQPVTTVPTVGFNVECYLQGNIKLNIWVKKLFIKFLSLFPCRTLVARTRLDRCGVIIMLVVRV